MDECIFCKIVRNELPANRVYEDDIALAFLDIQPNVPGHTLVIPKQHAVNIFDIDAPMLAGVVEAIRRVAPGVRDGVGAHGVHVNSNHGAAAGQIVDHLHFHIIPRHSRDEFEFWPHHNMDAEEAKVIAEKIRQALS